MRSWKVSLLVVAGWGTCGGFLDAKVLPAPTFVLPPASPHLTFSVVAFRAEGKTTGYAITRTPIPPAADASVWSNSPPAVITEAEPGVYDYYAWVKDEAGCVSLYAEQTVDVATTKITVGPQERNFSTLADAIAEIARRGNPKGCVIELAAGEYPSWRAENEYKDRESFLKNIARIAADNLTIRGVGGSAHLAYKCRGPDTARRWTMPPFGTQHGSVIVQSARNLRLENLEISGGCEATSGNGAGLWVEPTGVGTVVKHCFFHDNDNGILTSRIPGARVVIMHGEFCRNGAPGPFQEGQNHNVYIGEVGELIFMFNYSHASQRGQLLKSRAARNYVLYNRLTDEDDSNYPIDLPFGGESYVIGNLVQMSHSNRCGTFINYGREVLMEIRYKNGGPEPLRDLISVTNTRNGQQYRVHSNFNYGATGAWESKTRASRCSLKVTAADKPDLVAGDKLAYDTGSFIEVTEARWQWSSPRREIHVVNNTFVNECAQGYGQYVLRAHPDTEVALLQNNLIVDLKPPGNRYRLWPDAAGGRNIREKAVIETNNVWCTTDPGFRDLSGSDYSLTKVATAAIDKALPPLGTAGTVSLLPVFHYVHKCRAEPRPWDGKLDVGGYECTDVAGDRGEVLSASGK